VSLQLAVKDYDDLEKVQHLLTGELSIAKTGLVHVYVELAACQDQNRPPSAELVRRLHRLTSNHFAVGRVIGQILLNTLERSPGYSHVPRESWEQPLVP
jgi:hypothetical protein